MTVDGKKIIAYMKAKEYRIRAINIVYLEDVDVDTWEPVKGRLDIWDDARILVRNTGEILLNSTATTEPGAYYTYNRLNTKGAFRIALGQHQDSWCLGDHKGQRALVQIGDVSGYRDANEDGIRTGDLYVTGDSFGINQHTTSKFGGASPDRIGQWSAGCLVGRYSSTHYEKFIPTLEASGNETFDTTIIPGDEFSVFDPD